MTKNRISFVLIDQLKKNIFAIIKALIAKRENNDFASLRLNGEKKHEIFKI